MWDKRKIRGAGLALSMLVACGAGDEPAPDGGQGGAGGTGAITCGAEDLLAGSSCGCHMDLPIDLDRLMPANPGTPYEDVMWPFGAHGGSHPEGHPGWDFASTTDQDVLMPDDGKVVEISAPGDDDPEGNLVGLALECGVRVIFAPMRPDKSLVEVGRTFRRGQRLGGMSFVHGRYFLHFGVAVSPGPNLPGTGCPSVFFDATTNGKMQALVDRSHYNERVARQSEISCADGTKLTIDLPAEDRLCNARLSPAARDRLKPCVPRPLSVW